MKRKLLLSILGTAISLSAMSQTITAPSGQSLIITNPVNVTGGGINIPNDSTFKIGGATVFNTKGLSNVLIGAGAGAVNTGSFNSFLGKDAGRINTTGQQNFFFGTSAGYNNIGGSFNAFLGVNAGFNNSSGDYNLFFGPLSGFTNTSGQQNTAIGAGAGYGNTIGKFNLFMGTNAGFSNTSGDGNTYLGYNSGGSATLMNATAIGSNAVASASNTVVLGNGATTITGTGLGGSGLRFPNLTSGSAVTSVPGGRVLSVDGSGNVVLVQLSAVTTGATLSVGQPVSDNWKQEDGYLYNKSTNGVVIGGQGMEGNALIVKGGVLSKEVNVKVEGSESWPDYVFQPSYKRMSLDEVEKFITVNKHLPNVPSAAEMAITGNNLGKTDVKLLEKVEELTLYLLEMKKANDAQSAELQSLKNQMNKLKKNRK
jgi:trimeric autotransporter adhesin